jgi:hypothetical protein
MESNIALVYMTLNMIIILYLFNLYVSFSYNNFLLTRQRLKTALFFLIFLVLVRTICFQIRFVDAPSPAPCFVKDIRIAIDAIFKCLSFSLTWISPGSKFIQFLMPKV